LVSDILAGEKLLISKKKDGVTFKKKRRTLKLNYPPTVSPFLLARLIQYFCLIMVRVEFFSVSFSPVFSLMYFGILLHPKLYTSANKASVLSNCPSTVYVYSIFIFLFLE
jgi:hypothetical protein